MNAAVRGTANELIIVRVADENGPVVRIVTYEHGASNDPSADVRLGHRAALALIAALSEAVFDIARDES